MEIICKKENLKNSLNKVINIVGRNNNLPILNNVLIRAKKNFWELIATDLEIGIKCQVRGKIVSEGEYTLPAKLFFDYLNLLDEEKINLKLEEEGLVLKTDNNQTIFHGNSAEDFPHLPEIKEEGINFSLNNEDLKDGLEKIVFAAASGEVRPEISGILFNFLPEEKKLVAVATDSYRLAEIKIPLKKIEKEASFILPAKTAQEVIRIISLQQNKQQEVEISLTPERQVVFSFNDDEIENQKSIFLVSKLIEGEYPHYQEIIPKEFPTKIVLAKNDLFKAVKAASLFSEEVNTIKLKFLSQEVLVTSSSTKGENKSKVFGKLEGEENQISLNSRYLLDGLRALKGEEVIFQVGEKDMPCALKPLKGEYLYLLMPIIE